MGGVCTWSGEVGPIARAGVAWGGRWAQLLLYACALAVTAIHGPPATLATVQFADAFTRANLWIIALNLLPVPPLDGAKAWPLFPLLWRAGKGRLRLERRVRAKAARSASLLDLERRDALEQQAANAAPAKVKAVVDSFLSEVKKR